MKLLKKINKGIILSIIVLIILIIYNVTLQIGRNQEKVEIEEVCKQYLAFEDKYTVLPKEYQSFTNKIPEEKLKQYKEEMSKELKKVIVSDNNIYELQKTVIEDKLDEQVNSNKIFASKNSKLVDITKYEFQDDQVTVIIENLMEIEFIELIEQEEKIQNETIKIEDIVTLKKQDDNWKVIYANVGIIEESYEEMFDIEITRF